MEASDRYDRGSLAPHSAALHVAANIDFTYQSHSTHNTPHVPYVSQV